jgi:hypothetical protein
VNKSAIKSRVTQQLEIFARRSLELADQPARYAPRSPLAMQSMRDLRSIGFPTSNETISPTSGRTEEIIRTIRQEGEPAASGLFPPTSNNRSYPHVQHPANRAPGVIHDLTRSNKDIDGEDPENREIEREAAAEARRIEELYDDMLHAQNRYKELRRENQKLSHSKYVS